nr:receptor-like protein EIX1 [Ziziphus jujuba var. spinosa]
MSRLSRKIEIAVKSFLLVYLLRSVVVSNSESGVGSHETRCIDEERRALLKFKDNLESYNNDTLSSWSYEEEKKDCCSWDGIRCDSISGHVIMLDLSHLQLSTRGKSLNPPLIELRYLNYLDLSGINLRGNNISSLIGNNMVSLQHLDLSSTQLEGSIPETFGNNMTSLSYLDLSFSYLTGPIPNSLGNMSLLAHLNLRYNGFTGSIPESFANLETLTYLDLSGNMLNGSIQIIFENMTGTLTFLALGYSGLEGHIPKSFGEKMSVLAVLDLSYNRLRGSIPESFGNMVKLTYLSLEQNLLEGHIPEALGNMSILEHLDLTDNTLEGGSVHPSIGQLSQLEKLDISNNVLEGVISEAHFLKLSKLRLEIISLSSCKLGPKFPNWLQTQVNYSVLEISNTGISDSIPIWFWNTSTEFHTMNASNNQISGRIANLSVLKWGNFPEVDFSSNQLEGAIPTFLFNVTTLYLSRNKFSNLNCLCDVKVRASLVDYLHPGKTAQAW